MPTTRSGPRGARPWWRLHAVAVIAGILGLAVTAAVGWAVSTIGDHEEQRLLSLDVHQAASTVTATLPSVQSKLTAAYEVAMVTDASPVQFRHAIKATDGLGVTFDSVSLWHRGSPTPSVVIGAQPELERTGDAAAFLAGALPSPKLDVTPILRHGGHQVIGYAEVPAGSGGSLIVYAESSLAPGGRIAVPASSPFSGLEFAAYLGRDQRPRDLIATTGHLPFTGPTSTAVVAFGNTSVTLVGTATEPLVGTLTTALPWIVAGVGVVLSGVVALVAERLVRRRRHAERVAASTAELYAEQRANSETLQRALLPSDLPEIAGLEVAVRYVPGVSGTEVGGDWYDVVATNGNGCTLVVGDVSGRGLLAANTMAALHYAIRAYAAQGETPDAVLQKLTRIVDVSRDGRFATVLCAEVAVAEHRVTLVSAGHPPPVVVDVDGARLVDLSVAPPIGVERDARPEKRTIAVGHGALLVAYTDGLVERRGEPLDQGLERLRTSVAAAASGGRRSMEQVLDAVLADLTPEGSDDDIALMGVRWRS